MFWPSSIRPIAEIFNWGLSYITCRRETKVSAKIGKYRIIPEIYLTNQVVFSPPVYFNMRN